MEQNINYIVVGEGGYLKEEENKMNNEINFCNFQKEEIQNNNNNEENFVIVFDQIFNRSTYFNGSNYEEDTDIKESEEKKNYFESNDNQYNNNANIEQKLKNVISSLSEERIVNIMRELYSISDSDNIFSYRYNALLLAKKLINELRDRINIKIQNFEKN